MTSIFEKELITKADLEQLINDKIEESLNLDYKRGDGLKKTDGSKKELAKDVSAFANSAGGLIIYGIDEAGTHVPQNFHFVNGNEITKEWIEHILQTRIHRKIPGLKILAIRNDGKNEESIYIIKIPESIEAPHQTSDGRYYKRYNFESVPMEEYEVRSLYNKFTTTTFKIDDLIINKRPKKHGEGNLAVWIHSTNSGKLYEEKYKLKITCPKSVLVDRSARAAVIDKKNLNYSVKYTGENETISKNSTEPIFPNEKFQFGFLEMNVESLELLKGLKLTVEMTHKGGVVKRDFNLENLIKQSDIE